MNTPKTLKRQLAIETRNLKKAVNAANVYANNINNLQGRMSNYMTAAKKAATRKIKKPCKSKGYGMGRRGKC